MTISPGVVLCESSEPPSPVVDDERTLLVAAQRAQDADAGFCALTRYDPAEGRVVLARVQGVGDPDLLRGLQQLEGASPDHLGLGPEDLPDPDGHLLLDADDLAGSSLGAVAAGRGIGAARFFGAVRDQRCFGFLVLLWRTGQPVPCSRRTSNRWLRQVTRVLAPDPVPPVHHRVPDGGILLLRGDGSCWMTDVQCPVLPEECGDEVAAFCRSPVARAVLYGRRHRLRLTRVTGAECESVVIEIARLEPPEIPPFLRLSKQQKKVAAYLAHGATVPESARALGRGPDTVKGHVVRIYRALQIGSRAELAAEYEAAQRWQPGGGSDPH